MPCLSALSFATYSLFASTNRNFMFADDIKIIKSVMSELDYLALQGMPDCVMHGVILDGSSLMKRFKDLGITFSADLTWRDYHCSITAKAYQMLGLMRRSFGTSCKSETKKHYTFL